MDIVDDTLNLVKTAIFKMSLEPEEVMQPDWLR